MSWRIADRDKDLPALCIEAADTCFLMGEAVDEFSKELLIPPVDPHREATWQVVMDCDRIFNYLHFSPHCLQ